MSNPSEASGEILARPPLIPEGEYRLKFDGWVTCTMWGKQTKLVAWFSIADFGEHFRTRISRYYNIRKIVGKPGRNGAFKVSWSCDLTREYGRLLPVPTRLDRIYLHRLSNLLIVGEVETVRTTSAQEQLSEGLQYSVIRRLVRVEAGADIQATTCA
jgi:hypothetical protein